MFFSINLIFLYFHNSNLRYGLLLSIVCSTSRQNKSFEYIGKKAIKEKGNEIGRGLQRGGKYAWLKVSTDY